MTPATRTRIYVIAFVIVVACVVAAVIFRLTDLATAQNLVLWVGSIFGLPLGVAVAHRPTKPTP
jgi:uncharacterized membrane protein YfcA